MPKRTNPFQQLTASIMATIYAPDYIIEESVIEFNPKTGLPREIDIKIINKNNTNDKFLVECRDHKRKQDVIWIDSLDGKARRLGFKKVIAVSSSGFYKTAEIEAKSRKIETMRLREAEELDWKKWLFSISEFGVNIDEGIRVKKINLVSPNTIQPSSMEGVSLKEIFLVNLKKKSKISLFDYVNGLINDPKYINFARTNNMDNAITHYDITIPCDAGLGYALKDGKFTPLIKVTFSLDSSRKSYKISMKHIKLGEKKLLVGEEKILGNKTRVILEEKEGFLGVMLETKIQKAKNVSRT